uniref:Uncharacterized protein n=1 Tax=Bracon brevicornis TaxID=1563983 RepID=A0A6V7L6C2_9HYME
MDSSLIKKKVAQFDNYINNVLKSNLAELSDKLDEKNTEIAEFLQLKSIIITLKNTESSEIGFKTKIDLGNNFFIQANVNDPSHILIDIGLGYYVEFTLDDALKLIGVRIKLFESQINNLRREIAKTNAHIKYLLIGIRQLQGMDD